MNQLLIEAFQRRLRVLHANKTDDMSTNSESESDDERAVVNEDFDGEINKNLRKSSREREQRFADDSADSGYSSSDQLLTPEINKRLPEPALV